ncbi:MAG: hypothetical protein KDD06_29095 [Phaeodactylibacter sp.]|nr:hypothetical protein [Phaeodactylibacter sp.]MCB9286334.1 hypothetical protein [Lewinellaceae bacterium]
MKRIRPFEIFLIELVIYLFIWVVNDYMASMISLIFGCIFLLILLASFVMEMVEKSKVPRSYFIIMGLSVLAPVIAALLYLLINKGMEWM